MVNWREKLRGVLVSRVAMFSAFFVLTHAAVAHAQPAPAISVTVNKSMVFRLAERAKRVSVSQPAVADVIVVAPSQLLINGKAVGATSLIVFSEQGDVSNFDLIVTPDVAALRSQLRVVLPKEKVEVSTSGPSLVLSGEVSNEVVYDKVLEIARTYVPPKPPAAVAPPAPVTNVNVRGRTATLPTSGMAFAGGGQLVFDEENSLEETDRWGDKRKIEGIVDLLIIKEIRQVELDVIVAEVQLGKLRDIGFDFRQTKTNPNSSVDASTFLGSVANLVGTGLSSGSFAWVNGAYTLTTLYRLLQNKDIAEILAQPRLVMKNGRSGGFLAGGEFPIVERTTDTFNVVFKPFGVRLDFVPTIGWSDRIDLRVFPEVSEIDETRVIAGVPAFTVRRSVNRVDLREGESLVIGGLLDRRITKSLGKFPLLGDIPILGALFRSTHFQNKESELVFVITPRIVRAMKPGEKPRLPSLEKYDDEDMRQIPLPGTPEEQKPASRGATIP